MTRTRRANMHLRSVFVILQWHVGKLGQPSHSERVHRIKVLSVVAESCDEETEYTDKNGNCCKLCPPGKRMMYLRCRDPDCSVCEVGEYQDHYNKENLCKRQPNCNHNLNLVAQSQSNTKRSPCVCIPDHHCADSDCNSCVRNTECQPGQKISKNGTRTADTVCELCSTGTFSVHKSALTCEPWTQCSSGYKEVSPGSSTSDRICEVQSRNLPIILPVISILLLSAVIGLFCCLYKKGITGSVCFVQKLQRCTFTDPKNTHQPAQDIETGEPLQPLNQPQEDTEDLVKPDAPLSPGVSENGMPVIQDHSKSLILSEAETEPESCSVHL